MREGEVDNMYNLEIKFWKVITILKGLGSQLSFFWRWTTKVWISNRIGDPSSPYPESMGIICEVNILCV